MNSEKFFQLIAIPSPINQIADQLGANDLPYRIPIHPNLVHFTIGLFAIGIAFDFAGAFYSLEKRIFRFLALPVTRTGFHDVGWYNVLACSVITFFTVAAGFYEMLLAVPLPGEIRTVIGQNAINTMIWHAIGGVALLLIIVVMTIWRGYQRFVWRKDFGREVTWLYLFCGATILLVMGVHGSLGAWLASEFGVHITADQLLAAGADLKESLP
ncbi:putative conserved membrane protein [Synechococcus sp. MIT S9220]|uniref:DUF2231 domain-containing protein n=1 Tax=unclassified Synechococcus TaxID=2626047 RepID=UPI00164B739F|nr:DUF2231 domain-containing protein [Synechococcus sp. MIT S9220]NOL46461.1 DUF2231 domain-containing protein [Synechococcus sp. MIT S9220]QNJ23432.1 putative conserved membrane protein [Synechococcus sp. MIT S9220]